MSRPLLKGSKVAVIHKCVLSKGTMKRFQEPSQVDLRLDVIRFLTVFRVSKSPKMVSQVLSHHAGAGR